MTERFRDYDPFAWLYTRHWGREFHQQIYGVLRRLILRRLPRGTSILDLCCGDGRLAAELHRQGFHVTGIDGSAEMLKQARIHAPDITFVVADARTFLLKNPVEVVLSTFDSLNHIMSRRDLSMVFRRVFHALTPGGYFAFDLNRHEAYDELWTTDWHFTDDESAAIARGSYDARRGIARCDVTLFRRRGAVAWARSDFTLRQKHHPHATVTDALKRAGFSPIAAYDGRGDLGMRGPVGQYRTFYLARKPQTADSNFE